ncbi:hypothetical protein CR513_36989, partial [Mucuna pruriens]
MKEATFANDSNSVLITDNDIYLEVVGGKNEKGNVYGLGKLTNKFMHSTQMRKTIRKLNNELVEKTVEKSLEEKVVQLLHNDEEQSEQI